MSNQINITVETGEKKVVNVYDIIDSYAFKKTFVIYDYVDEPNKIYASILNETDTTFSFDPITNPDEQAYIASEVQRVINEQENTL